MLTRKTQRKDANTEERHFTFKAQRQNMSNSGDVTLETQRERWGARVETQKNVRGEVGGWGRVPFNEPYAPSLSTIYDGA